MFFAIINSLFISGYATRPNLFIANMSIVSVERTDDILPSEITRTSLIPDNADSYLLSFGVDDIFDSIKVP